MESKSTWFQNSTREVRDSPTSPDGFQPKQGSVTDSVGWNHEEKDLRRSKEKAASLNIKVGGGGRRYGESPEFLAKGQFWRGTGGGVGWGVVTIYASAKGGGREWGRMMAWKGDII